MYYLSTNICETSAILKILKFISELINIVFIIIPMILIIMLMIDLGKAVIANNEDVFKKSRSTIIRRIILCMVLFLVPKIVMASLLLLESAGTTALNNYNTCIENMNNIKYYENLEVIEKKKNDEEERRKEEEKRALLRSQTAIKTKSSYSSKESSSTNSLDGDTSGTIQGKTYNLTTTEIKKLAAVCVREQGSKEKGIRAEAELIANLYELKGKKYKNPYEYVAKSGWFGSGVANINTNKASSQAIAIIKEVFVLGNRTLLPLYVDEHDCWNCNSGKYCSQGYKGDICTLNNNGSKITGLSNIKNRKNYKKGVTKIHTVYQSSSEYWTFYIFPTSISDPFGYTPSSYKKIKGK